LFSGFLKELLLSLEKGEGVKGGGRVLLQKLFGFVFLKTIKTKNQN
jgi:hypothetical protein